MAACWIEIADPEVIKTSGKRFHPIVEASDNPADEVQGKVFRITEAELKAADAYEVADDKRIEVLLRSETRPGSMFAREGL